jgi:hypothetical protein
MSKTEYTCVGKGGRYELIATAVGAGPVRGEVIRVYRCKDTGRTFWRPGHNFDSRIVEVAK